MKYLFSTFIFLFIVASAQAQMSDGIIEVGSSPSGFEKAAVGYRWSDTPVTGYTTIGYHRVNNQFDAFLFGIGGDARKEIRIPFTQIQITPIIGSTVSGLFADFGSDELGISYTIESYAGLNFGRFDILSGINWNLQKGNRYWQPVSIRMRF